MKRIITLIFAVAMTATVAAAQELKNGGGTRCNTFEDYLKAVQSL